MKKIFFLIATIFIISCNSKVDMTPRKVNFDRDVCVTCLMGIAEKNYAAQAVNPRGKVIWFDDIGCFVEYLEDLNWEKFCADGKPSVWIADAETGEWLDIYKAYYRFGDRTPMGYGYGALKEKKEGYFDYETAVKRIKEGKTKRDEFKKMKMSQGGMKCAPGKCGEGKCGGK